MAITTSEWKAAKLAAKEYQHFATEIEKIRKDIKLFRQGLKNLIDISPDHQRVEARLARELKMHSRGPSKDIPKRERILGQADFQDVFILKRLAQYARCVGRVVLPNGFGTGWLIGENLMITNHHVLPNRRIAARSCIIMDYERREDGLPQNGETFNLRPDLFFITPRETDGEEEFRELDFTIVGVEPVGQNGNKLSDYTYIKLDGGLGKVLEGENCILIQHPGGDYKKVVLRETRLLKVGDIPGADDHIFYESDTLPGSSGSPVFALGTGEVVALHNAGVPRMDSRGNYLKKNGDIFKNGDDEEDVDWMANQGVRVSKLVEAIGTLALPEEMEEKRKSLMKSFKGSNIAVSYTPLNITNRDNPKDNPSLVASAINGVDGSISLRFIIRLINTELAKKFAKENILRIFPGSTIEPLSWEGDEGPMGCFFEVQLNGSGDPWELAARLETIDGVEQAEPDLPQYTTMGIGEFKSASTHDLEKLPITEKFFWESGRGNWDEERFIRGWKDKRQLKGLNPEDPNDLKEIRQWNHKASGFAQYYKSLASEKEANLKNTLVTIKMAQFDTGYSEHSKVEGGFNLEEDFDCIDDDNDAKDSETRGILKFPGHGTRTGSVVVGVKDSLGVLEQHEGNVGLLRSFSTSTEKPVVQLTPFRIAKSVILIGRIGELVKAVHRTVENGFEVLTMSMGSLGNAALEEIARLTYEKGVIWCCAAGNQVRFVVAPAKYAGVIAVAASNPDDGPWSGSCRGPEVDITAPGEDIYVPILNQDDQEDMAYGSGTSYAVPHVASAAMLWMAKYKEEIGEKYNQPWQRVEAFRYCLQVSARKSENKDLDPKKFGPGILDVQKLMSTELPKASALKHAYTGANGTDSKEELVIRPFEKYKTISKQPLAMRELIYKDWQNLVGEGLHKKLNYVGATESLTQGAVTLSATAKAFGKLLVRESTNGKANAKEVEVAAKPTPETSFHRLLEIDKLKSGAKPRYEAKTELLPPLIPPTDITDQLKPLISNEL